MTAVDRVPTEATITSSRQVVFQAKDVLTTSRIDVPALRDGEILIRVRRVGICGSDLHLLAGHMGDPYPLVPGHEFVGEVAAIGGEDGLRGLAVGDRVAVEMLLSCRFCDRCREGRYNLCEHDDPAAGHEAGRQLGVNIPRTIGHGLWGGYADYLLVPAEAIVHRLPHDLPWDRAVLIEPLAVAHHAIQRGRVRAGENVVIIGPGPIGLLSVAAAHAAGAARVVVVGTRPQRLKAALRLGADVVVDPEGTDDVSTAVRDALDGTLPDLAIEAAGAPTAQQDVIRLVRRGGRAVLVGACGAGKTVTLQSDADLLAREVDVLPSYLSSGGFEPAIAQLTRGELPFDSLVTHTFPLEDVAEAFRLLETREDGVIKVALDPTR